MKISYITRTMWRETRLAYIREAEQSLAVQHWIDDSEWILVSEVPPVSGVLQGLIKNTVHITDPSLKYATKHTSAIAAAQGEYIAFLDDDNRKMPEFARVMVGYIETTGARGVFCFARTIDANGQYCGHHHISTVNYDDAWRVGGFYHLEEMMVRKDLLLEVGGFDEQLEASEDYDLALRLIRTRSIVLLPTPLAELRQGHSDAASQSSEFTGDRTQLALHRILDKHGRLNRVCPHCTRDFTDVPWLETHIQWTQPQNCFMRICRNGEAQA